MRPEIASSWFRARESGPAPDSGIGRELGPEGLAAYRSLKSVYC